MTEPAVVNHLRAPVDTSLSSASARLLCASTLPPAWPASTFPRTSASAQVARDGLSTARCTSFHQPRPWNAHPPSNSCSPAPWRVVSSRAQMDYWPAAGAQRRGAVLSRPAARYCSSLRLVGPRLTTSLSAPSRSRRWPLTATSRIGPFGLPGVRRQHPRCS